MITADASLPAAFVACVLPYIPGDIIKGAVAVAASKRLSRILYD
jgi:biotin transporter BioY